MTTYHITTVSNNRKTGRIPVTTTSRDTCPDSCPLKKSGCMADGGPLAMHWSKVSNGVRGGDLKTLTAIIKKFPVDQVWRHNQAGDLPGEGDSINAAELATIVKANRGRRGFTYTHKPATAENIEAIRHANENGFTVNLSANGPAHVDELAVHGLPIATIMPEGCKAVEYTASGIKIVRCPAYKTDKLTCANCQLCAKPDRSYVIGLPVHGSGKKKAAAHIN